MIILPGYKVIEILYDSDQTKICRGVRISDSKRVVLKILNSKNPSSDEIAQFKREYELISALTIEGVIGAYGLEKLHNTYVMVLEDFDGKSLNLMISERRFRLDEILSIAIQISDILGRIHKHDIMHKDINPSNILWNPPTNIVKLIDFGISATIPKENPAPRPVNALEGTLNYMSPEQTGRMNRAVDYRTDFYSLGVTLYETLTGELPFQSSDLMSLIHFHIAKQPIPPCERSAAIPKAISDITMKLLSKTAEDRYQSAFGLGSDLKICRKQLEATGVITPFEIGRHDITGLLQIPQKLYGRDKEINILQESFERVCSGIPELLLVEGYTGIGKTALVQEIHKPIIAKGGYFISGKFDQFSRGAPYSSIIDAFQELTEQVLTENESQIDRWRRELTNALGPNGQVIVDVIPEVEYIIGPQPEVPGLPPNESLNRFNMVFQKFVRVFSAHAHPLVIFLDDLQWVDRPTLQLISQLLAYPDPQSLMIIGAYRDNEVDATHPLTLAVDDIAISETRITTIHLEPLQAPYVDQLVSETLSTPPELSEPLSRACFDKTRGNPFFLNQFFITLNAEGTLAFDSSAGAWTWNLSHIQRMETADNVLDFMAYKIKLLPQEAGSLLRLSACIGARFDLNALSVLCGLKEKETAEVLFPCIDADLILPLDEAYRYAGEIEGVKIQYRFLHDRVQQSAYTMLDDTEKEAIHHKIGKLLLERSNANASVNADIFDIVNQLNGAKGCLASRKDRIDLARLNLIAGKKARSSAAFEPAFRYFITALELTDEIPWEKEYDLILELHSAAAESAYLIGDYGQMDRLCQTALENVRNVLDRAGVHEIQIMANIARKHFTEAIGMALETLNLLGVRLPKNPGKASVLAGLIRTKASLTGKKIDALTDRPDMTDPSMLTVARILNKIVPAVYIARPMLNLIIAFKCLRLSIKYGLAPSLVFAFGGLGGIYCGVLGDMDNGYQFGELVMKLVRRFKARDQEARLTFFVNAFIRHWKDHLKTTIPLMKETFQIGMETGDFEFAAYSAHNYCLNKFITGNELGALEKEMEQYSRLMRQKKQKAPLGWNDIWQQAILNLMGRSEYSCRLSGDAYDEAERMAEHIQENERTAIFVICLSKLILCYLFGEYEEALSNAQKAKKDIEGVAAMPCFALFYFYEGLTCLALYPSSSGRKKRRLLKIALASQKRLERWARFAPENYSHKYHLMDAEISRVLGKEIAARREYTLAIEKAIDSGYIQEAAIALERCAIFWMERKDPKKADHFLSKAVSAYRKWGAAAKVSDLQSRFSHFLNNPK